MLLQYVIATILRNRIRLLLQISFSQCADNRDLPIRVGI